ncbi:hypothetical protein BDA99DRAFT_298490 [Phascolomyces articulosus]|uniref:TMEM62 C-terminal domain-containing protein n=1 Tax=Phascolomyces articulosus TaxID=60185 RepID=A0AAD5K6L8_9FUNG|nr:hypothetical protein BDA99DRAFT_298490 [Phascolomyces articulosus]
MTLMIPKIYNDLARKSIDDQSYPVSTASLQNRLLLKIHRIDQFSSYGPFQFIQRQLLLWTLRFLRLPQDQPLIWYTTFTVQLWLLALPWFQGEFIPSASTDANRYGTFYLWGLVLSKEWVPLADTWKFAIMAVNLDVGFLYRFFAWRCTQSTELHCLGSSKGQRQVRQINEHLWFKALEVIFWMWRFSVIIRLANCYGGVWPTLIVNILTVWLVFMGVMLVIGKNGLLPTFRERHRQRVAVVANGCRACQRAANVQPSSNNYQQRTTISHQEHPYHEPGVEHHALEEQRFNSRERDEHVLIDRLDENDMEENSSTSSHSSGASSSATRPLMMHSRGTGTSNNRQYPNHHDNGSDSKLD